MSKEVIFSIFLKIVYKIEKDKNIYLTAYVKNHQRLQNITKNFLKYTKLNNRF